MKRNVMGEVEDILFIRGRGDKERESFYYKVPRLHPEFILIIFKYSVPTSQETHWIFIKETVR
jgi:hypothetical protein